MSTPSTTNRAGRATPAIESASAQHKAEPNVLLLGFDWGTNTSCIQGANPGEAELIVNEMVPTIVGYAKEGIVNDLLPNEEPAGIFVNVILLIEITVFSLQPAVGMGQSEKGVIKLTKNADHGITEAGIFI